MLNILAKVSFAIFDRFWMRWKYFDTGCTSLYKYTYFSINSPCIYILHVLIELNFRPQLYTITQLCLSYLENKRIGTVAINNSIIFATFQIKSIWYYRCHYVKYQRSTTSGCKDIGNKKSEFLGKNLPLTQMTQCFKTNYGLEIDFKL